MQRRTHLRRVKPARRLVGCVARESAKCVRGERVVLNRLPRMKKFRNRNTYIVIRADAIGFRRLPDAFLKRPEVSRSEDDRFLLIAVLIDVVDVVAETKEVKDAPAIGLR